MYATSFDAVVPVVLPVIATRRLPALSPYAANQSVAPKLVEVYRLLFGTDSVSFPALLLKVSCCFGVPVNARVIPPDEGKRFMKDAPLFTVQLG